MDNDSFRQFLVNAFSSANEVMKPGAVFIFGMLIQKAIILEVLVLI